MRKVDAPGAEVAVQTFRQSDLLLTAFVVIERHNIKPIRQIEGKKSDLVTQFSPLSGPC